MPAPNPPPNRSEMLRAFGRIGVMSFGGPAAQIAVMHRELVEARTWLSEKQFLGALSFTMFLPGPEAMQLATWAGWRLGGTIMGLAAGLLFVLPGAVVIAVLALAYAQWGEVPGVQAAFLGIKALVVVIVAQALLRLSRKALKRPADIALAIAAFVAIFVFALPFPAIIAAAALAGFALGAPSLPEAAPATGAPIGQSLGTLALWLVIWALPLALVWLSGSEFLTDVALFFAKLALVTFGGAYAVLAYMAQAVVETHGWLTPQEMIDALGLAETTPGPLILVTQFTAMLAGAKAGGTGLALLAGAVCLWMTFAPCFLFIFVFAPHLDRLMAARGLAGALAGITAAVTGVIANLSLWFALQVVWPGGPDAMTPDIRALGLMALALVLLLVVRLGTLTALPVTAFAGWAISAL